MTAVPARQMAYKYSDRSLTTHQKSYTMSPSFDSASRQISVTTNNNRSNTMYLYGRMSMAIKYFTNLFTGTTTLCAAETT